MVILNKRVGEFEIGARKRFKYLVLCALLCSIGTLGQQTAAEQKTDELFVVPVTSNPAQEMMKHLLLGERGIGITPNTSGLTLEEVKSVTRTMPSVANAVRNLAGCTTNTLPANDDGSTLAIALHPLLVAVRTVNSR